MNLIDDGVVVHRDAIPRADVELFFAIADRAYTLVGEVRAGAAPKGKHADLIKHIAESSILWGGIPISHGYQIAAEHFNESPDGFTKITSRLEQVLAYHRRENGANYRNELSYFRRHNGSTTHIPWHFDAGAAGTVKYDPCFNTWVPLVQVGESSPTLQFIPKTAALARDSINAEHHYPRCTEIASGFDEASWLTPKLDPGDIVIFDHWTLHRTQPLSGKMRTSAEIRFSGIDQAQ
jgi:hypothetical protein